MEHSTSAHESRKLWHLIRNSNFHIPRGGHTVSAPPCKALLLPATSSQRSVGVIWMPCLTSIPQGCFSGGQPVTKFSLRSDSVRRRFVAVGAPPSISGSISRQACSSAIADVICQLGLLRQRSPRPLHKQIMRATAGRGPLGVSRSGRNLSLLSKTTTAS